MGLREFLRRHGIFDFSETPHQAVVAKSQETTNGQQKPPRIDESIASEKPETNSTFYIPEAATGVLVWNMSGYYGYSFVKGAPEQINSRAIAGYALDPDGNYLIIGCECVLIQVTGKETSIAQATNGLYEDFDTSPENVDEENGFEDSDDKEEDVPDWAHYEIIWQFRDQTHITYSREPMVIHSEREVSFKDEEGQAVYLTSDHLSVCCFPLDYDDEDFEEDGIREPILDRGKVLV